MLDVACAQAEARLQHYVDRQLSPAEVAEVEAHLAACPSCARCYRFESEMRASLKRLCSEPCPEALKVRLRNLCAECDCE